MLQKFAHRLCDRLTATGAIPLTMSGDHTIALPSLRALKRRHGPLGLIHVDAHADINEEVFGEVDPGRNDCFTSF